MTDEIHMLKNIVAEFTSRLAYETQQFERKFNTQVDLILTAQSNIELNIHQNKIKVQIKEALLPEVGFLRLKQIIGDKKANPPIPGIFPISRTAWYEGIKQGYFPKPINLGTRASLWRVEDIRNVLENLNKRLFA